MPISGWSTLSNFISSNRNLVYAPKPLGYVSQSAVSRDNWEVFFKRALLIQIKMLMLMHPRNHFLWLHIQLQAPCLSFSLRLCQLILVSSMDLVACCFLQSPWEEAALTFGWALAPVKGKGATEQARAVLVTGKSQAWLMALCNRASLGVPGKIRKCKAS